VPRYQVHRTRTVKVFQSCTFEVDATHTGDAKIVAAATELSDTDFKSEECEVGPTTDEVTLIEGAPTDEEAGDA
jgi:hypothetical protein